MVREHDMSLPIGRLHRFLRTDLDRMIEAGVVRAEDRVELLGGQIFDVSPQSSRHAVAVCLVAEALRGAVAGGSGAGGASMHVRVQMPLAIGEDSLPEPDVAVVAGSPRDWIGDHPTTARLVVEVADTSLAMDRGRKRDLYAQGGVPEYWVVDLVAGLVEAYVLGESTPGTAVRILGAPRVLGPRSTLRPGEPGAAVLARPVAVADLLP